MQSITITMIDVVDVIALAGKGIRGVRKRARLAEDFISAQKLRSISAPSI